MTRNQVLFELVKQEAKNLKKKATNFELQKLNFGTLNGESDYNCIYGQICGNCVTSRASELINSCAKRVYTRTQRDPSKCPVNGIPSGENRADLHNIAVSYYSPIEVFIATKSNVDNGNNEKLINYLKGKTTRLNFV